MAYVIAEPCIGTKDNSCVEVCPVDCIHPTPDEPDYDKVEMLYIDPEECIDCDACVEACPVDACFAEDQVPEEWSKYVQLNAEYFASGGGGWRSALGLDHRQLEAAGRLRLALRLAHTGGRHAQHRQGGREERQKASRHLADV